MMDPSSEENGASGPPPMMQDEQHKRRKSVHLTPKWDRPLIDGLMDEDAINNAGVAFFPDLTSASAADVVTTNGTTTTTATPIPLQPVVLSHPVNKENGLGALAGGGVLSSPATPRRRSILFGSTRKLKSAPLMPGSTAADDQKKKPRGDDDDKDEVSSTSSSTGSDEERIDSNDMQELAEHFWEDIPEAPADAILGIAQAYRDCEHPNKVNVCVGAYRDENGKPWVLPSVRQAERILLEEDEVKEYLPIEGDREYVGLAMKFAYGRDMPMDHVAGVQTLSGTGACAVGGKFLAQFWPNHPIYVPTPTWTNHIMIFKQAGLDVRKYRYYDRSSNGLNLKGMLRDLTKAPTGSIILLHACAHNPTGCDPTIEQWKKIVAVIRQRKHVAFFDSAYQGFATGDAEEDAQPFRYAVSQHVPILLAQSFAKNFGLYGERCGTLSVVCGDVVQKQHILSDLRAVIRPMYSSPPRHGSSIVKTILKDEKKLRPQYYAECHQMSDRIRRMRVRLVEELEEVGSTHDWSHVTKQIGMFAFTGLDQDMCNALTADFAIFLTKNGRISMAGLNESNIRYVAEAVHKVTEGKSITAGE